MPGHPDMAIRFAALLVASHGLTASLAAEAQQGGLRELVRADQVIE